MSATAPAPGAPARPRPVNPSPTRPPSVPADAGLWHPWARADRTPGLVAGGEGVAR